jgi:hypothetical protein
MPGRARGRLPTVGLLIVVSLRLVAGGGPARAAAADPLSRDLEPWARRLLGPDPSHPQLPKSTGIAAQSAPALLDAETALRGGNVALALLRWASVRSDLVAGDTVTRMNASERGDDQLLAAAWSKAGHDFSGPLRRAAVSGIEPAAVRAVAEAALLEAREYYQSSLDYARSTVPAQGWFYLRKALAERDLAALCRELGTSGKPRSPHAFRSLAPELDALEAELVRAYRPPVSLARHGEFIVASAQLKEARELDQAELRAGALVRMLQAAFSVARLTVPPGTVDAATLGRTLEAATRSFASSAADDSIGALFAAAGRDDLERNSAAAAAIVNRVLPLYRQALAPAPLAPPRAAPELTVTLVRWPYT